MINFRGICQSLVFILLMLLSLNSFAQRKNSFNRWYLSTDAGVSVFFGDVKRYDYIPDYESPSEIQPMFTGSIGKEFNSVLSVKGQFLYGELSGHKKAAHYNFQSKVLGGHLMANFNISRMLSNSRYYRSKFHIVASAGGGYMQWNSTLFSDIPFKDGDDVMDESQEGSLSFPGSLGVEYALNDHLSLNANGSLYVIASDLVDAKEGGMEFDMVTYYGFGLSYKIKARKKQNKRIANTKDQTSEMLFVREDEAIPADSSVVAMEQEIEEDQLMEISEETLKEKPLIEESDEPALVLENEIQPNENESIISVNPISNPVTNLDTDIWSDIEFSVQFLASKVKHEEAELKEKFQLEDEVFIKNENGIYKYVVGSYDKLWKAKETQNQVREESKIEEAFIVVYRNNERISLEEAMNYAAQKQLLLSQSNAGINYHQAEKVYPLVELHENVPQTGITIGVQILSMKSNAYPMGVFKGMFNIDKPIVVSYREPWYKLVVTGFANLSEAKEFQNKVRNKGFSDAFVLVFKDGNRMSLKKYKELGGE